MKVPKLRFEGFIGNWEERKLNEVSSYSNGGSYENDVKPFGKYKLVTLKSVDMKGNLVDSGKYINIEVPTLIKGTLVMILSEQAPGLLGMTAQIPENNKYVLNQRVAEIRPKNNINSYFLSMAINRYQQYFSKRGAGTKVQNISKGNVENFKFYCPIAEEQKKIGCFFEKIDKKIQLQQEKIDLLKEQKKGLMQKIFSQELRFKNEDGQAFPEWTNKALGDLGKFGISYSYSRAIEGEGSIQHIHYGDIHSKLPTVCDQFQFTSITEQREFEFVNEGDLLFADASEDYNNLGKAILVKSLQSAKTIAGLHTHKFTPNELVDSLYLIYVTQTKEYREYIKKMGTGVSVLSISKSNLGKFDILFPSLGEQKKIGKFLFSFDKKIHVLNNQKDYLIKQKQAFMQQMFI